MIEEAVRRLPDPRYAPLGAFLETALKSRRDLLATEALDFHRLIFRQAEITATDRDERVVLEHLADGDLRVSNSYRNGPRSEAPYFERTFRRGITSEVRLFLQGGDDLTEVQGARGRIKVRVIGGGGDESYVNTSRTGGGNTPFYDDRGSNEFEGSARIDRRSYKRPPSNNLVHRYAGGRSPFRVGVGA